MLQQLRDQCSLLREYVERSQEDHRFLGEVASKVRLLACRFGKRNYANRPLLTDLMLEYQLEASLSMPKGDVTLPQYMALVVLQLQRPVQTPSGGLRFEWSELRVHEFVRAWAEQAGGAHQDWEIEDWLAIGFRLRDKEHKNQVELRKIAYAVLDFAESFFLGLEARRNRSGSYEPALIRQEGPLASN